MKKLILILALACGSASAGKPKCETKIEKAPNALLEIFALPFKAVATFSHIPRCAISRFPTKKEEK